MNDKNTVSRSVASRLLNAKAVRIQPNDPFTWASGWKSPIYCDNRKMLSYPAHRDYIKRAFAQMVVDLYPEVEVIAGVATGAIAWGSLVADALHLPFVYIRSSAKDHGLQNLIEGDLKDGAQVVVIEDLISTGGSSYKAVEALQQAKADVMGMLAVYTHGFTQADELFNQASIPMHTLSNYNDVIDEAATTGYVSQEDVNLLKEWRENPSEWGK